MAVIDAYSLIIGSYHFPCTVRTDDTFRVRFWATLGEEPEVKLALV